MKKKTRTRKPESYTTRSYRQQAQSPGLVVSLVCVKETDLHIQADRDVQRRAHEIVLQCRLQLEQHIIKCPQFLSSLLPLAKDFSAPPLIREMYDAARMAGVGPMAAVAGGIAEFVGTRLLAEGAEEIVVENGGDIFLSRKEASLVAIFAGESPLSCKVGIELSHPMPWGICTSLGTVGHSLSMGKADSVTVVCRSTYLADAAATRLGNEIGNGEGTKSIERVLQKAREIEGVLGAVVICGTLLGAVGGIKLVRLEEGG